MGRAKSCAKVPERIGTVEISGQCIGNGDAGN